MTITLLTDIAPLAEFEAERAAGYIRVQTHPTLPLDIYNYAEITQFERHWTPVTLACRGLIVRRDTLEVVARPFSKFFNYGESSIDPSLLVGKIEVTDKLDGSLGITYPTPDGIAISTRGSFMSEQAQHATELYRNKYAGAWTPDKNLTYLFEIIYPTNRIVVSYGELDDLVLLGAVDIRTGVSVSAAEVENWPGARVEVFAYDSIEQVLAAPPRDNREGMVVRYLATDTRVKYKFPEYVRLHRIVTGVNEKRIWELLAAEQDIDSWLADLPDEFVKYVNETRDTLIAAYTAVDNEVREVYATALAGLGPDAVRKDYAIAFNRVMRQKERTGLLFNLLDDQPQKYREKIWRLIEPKIAPNHHGEDAA